ncbi:FAD-binding oxidoreductase [Nonomuraea soli]|uniref:FAD/FMN-containing dehydrogenase n=1 Tax=Nonomuraea soli TaxID=1032476 RepID=A0A7W0CQ20_9ACTN|nr:FAD-binding oxidoreductase [Nonomuraea soli]MBA2895231.1 FAD/FMN-containing dehydrogenase [Nonomuraea soli]
MINDVRGRVLCPGDDGFEAAATPWNLAIIQHVSAVVEAEDASDVAAAVRHARLTGRAVTVQPGGHGATPGLDGEILVRTGRMRSVEVRPEERLARVEAGASWGEVLTAAGKHGLTGLAGSSPVVSVAGMSLGGGLSWFGRAHGLAGNAVRALEVVDSEGAHVRVTADSDPDLFWAMRGAGGDFGVVTAMEIALFPASVLYGGRLLWPANRLEQVLSAFRKITADAPDELSLWFTTMQFPPLDFVPEPLRGLHVVLVDCAFLGDAATGRELLRPLERIPGVIFDTRDELPVSELGFICAEPVEPMPSQHRAELLTDLDDATTATLLKAVALGQVTPDVVLQIRHLGGALARPDADAGACGHLAEPYLVNLLGMAGEETGARQAGLSLALAPHVSGRKPYTFLNEGEGAAAAFPEATLARLRRIKRARDPQGLFRSNHPVLG